MVKRKLDREHVFQAIFAAITGRFGPAVRLRLLHEFRLVDGIVRAARADRLATARRLCDEVSAARRTYDTTAVRADALDVLFLPAMALIDLKEDRPIDALRNLDRSIEQLTVYFEEGLGDAGVAVLEQRLNRVRTLWKSGLADVFEAELSAFLATVIEGARPVGNTRRPYRGVEADAQDILHFYVNEGLFKGLERLDVPATVRVLHGIAATPATGTDATTVVRAAAVAAKLCSHDADTVIDIPADTLARAPFALMMVIDAATACGEGSAVGDALTGELQRHPDYRRCRSSPVLSSIAARVERAARAG